MNEREQKNCAACLRLPDESGLECLRGSWDIESWPPETRNLVFWDTFEWGVWFGGYLLYSCNNCYHLTDRFECWPGNGMYAEVASGRRRFWQDFESGPLRETLRGLLGLRGLAAVAEGNFRQQMHDLRNEAGKVICRLELCTLFNIEPEKLLLQVCRLLPLHGYETEAREVTACLSGAGATRWEHNPVELLLQASGNLPRRYTLRPAFGLKESTKAREAINTIVRSMLAIVHSNLPGILQDLDTEFLHDYRICLRKIRSLLSLLKGVYPAAAIQQIRAALGELARQTNRLRDLDVYLLARDEYLKSLPPLFRPALNRMFEDFSTERETEVRKVIAFISSPDFQQQLNMVSEFFAEESSQEASPAAELPVGPLVFAAIHRRYRKIRQIAARIDAATPDDGIHRLRIECKKLRYLMEFFSELIPDEVSTLLNKQLRRLQGQLGEFNDASVQQSSLLGYLEQHNPAPEVMLSLGGLISILYQRQQQSRALILQLCEEFCSAATASVFKRTFKLQAPVSVAGDHRRTDQ